MGGYKGASKNNSIVIWRILFSYLIVTYHFLNAYGKSTSFYIATDFFFIVSGFLLAKEENEKKYDNAFHMLKHKIKKFYPHYLFSFLIGWIVFAVLREGPKVSVSGLLLEIGMLQMVGVNLMEMINVPTWYLSVLLISSYIIYFMLVNYQKVFIELIAPAVIVIIGTWFYRNYGYLSHSSLGKDITREIYWNQPLFLGFSLMSIGILAFKAYKKVHIEDCSGGVFYG